MFNVQVENIEKVLKNYFEGIYYGDIAKLEKCFDEKAYLYGDINGESYRKDLNDYIAGVKKRRSPSVLKEKFDMKILGIEVLGAVATVKLHVPMLGFNYYDFLSLTIIDKEWKIVNKLFKHVE